MLLPITEFPSQITIVAFVSQNMKEPNKPLSTTRIGTDNHTILHF